MPDLLVEVDCPEPRMASGRLAASSDGTSWDVNAAGDGVWFCPVTNTAMLAPLPTTDAWRTTFTGDYARLTKADYTLTTSANWIEVPAGAAGDIFLQNKGVNELVRSTASYPANQPFFFSASVPGLKGMHKAIILDAYLGYGVTGEVILRFRADGSCELWSGGVLQDRASRSAGQLARGNSLAYHVSATQQHVSIMVLPMRRREIVVITNYGLVCSFTDTRLDLDTADNIITPAGPVGWNVPTGRACVQVAPIRFAASGTIYGPVKEFRYAPPIGATFGEAHSADRIGPSTSTIGATYTVTMPDGSAYTPNGVITRVRSAVQLTGDGDGTYGVYSVDAYYTPDPVNTADEPVDITEHITALSLAVGEDGVTSVSIEAKRSALIAAGMEQPTITTDRPIRVAIGAVDIFRGYLGSPQITYEEADTTLDRSTLEYQGQDRSGIFDTTTFVESVPYDGVTMQAAVEDLMMLAGFDTADLYMDTNSVRLSDSPDVSFGRWSMAPEAGETVGDVLQKIRMGNASTWITGWVPTLSGYTYQWRDPKQLSDTPAMVLYQKRSDAVAAGVAAALAPSRLVREMASHYEPPEANGVYVVGRDSRGNLLSAFAVDGDAQEPATLPADRPRNWRGRPVIAVYQDPALKEQLLVDAARDEMADRIMPGRGLIEWTSDVLVRDTTGEGDLRPLWLTDVVRIMDTDGTTVKGDYRIIAIPELRFEFEDTGGTRRHHRSATYRGLQVVAPQLDFSSADNSGNLYYLGGF